MNRYLATLVVAGVIAGSGFGADLKSGPEVGQGVTPFNPFNVTGADAGSKQCPV
jgi:hypothetical protein